MHKRRFTKTLRFNMETGLLSCKISRKKIQSPDAGFTLIETLVAITVLTVAVAAPLTLASQSLTAAAAARDQVIAFNLAQDAMETIRARRDNNILLTISGNNTPWLTGLPVRALGESVKPFVIDSYSTSQSNFIECSAECPNLLLDLQTGLYGQYDGDESKFKRVAYIEEVPDTSGSEVKVRVVVSWRNNALSSREVILEENLYNWIEFITL